MTREDTVNVLKCIMSAFAGTGLMTDTREEALRGAIAALESQSNDKPRTFGEDPPGTCHRLRGSELAVKRLMDEFRDYRNFTEEAVRAMERDRKTIWGTLLNLQFALRRNNGLTTDLWQTLNNVSQAVHEDKIYVADINESVDQLRADLTIAKKDAATFESQMALECEAKTKAQAELCDLRAKVEKLKRWIRDNSNAYDAETLKTTKGSILSAVLSSFLDYFPDPQPDKEPK